MDQAFAFLGLLEVHSRQTSREQSPPGLGERRACVLDADVHQVLRQLDIATSRTLAIEVVSGSGEVAADVVSISLWALGEDMLVRVLQGKVGL